MGFELVASVPVVLDQARVIEGGNTDCTCDKDFGGPEQGHLAAQSNAEAPADPRLPRTMVAVLLICIPFNECAPPAHSFLARADGTLVHVSQRKESSAAYAYAQRE